MTGLLLLTMVLVSVWGTRVRRRPWYAVVGVLATVVLTGGLLVPSLSLYAVEIRPFDLAVALAAIVLIIDVVGLPRPIAARIGLGLHSREWAFDGSLVRCFGPLNHQLSLEPPLESEPAHSAWRRETLRVGEHVLNDASRLRPPEEAWADLTRRYVQVYHLILDAVRSGDDGSIALTVSRMNEAVDKEREALRSRYRSDAAASGGRRQS